MNDAPMNDAPMAVPHPEPGAVSARPGRSWVLPQLDSAIVLGGIIALAAVLRFAGLGRHSLWFDEVFVVWVGAHRWQDVLPLLSSHDFHPPLYYLLIKAWTGVAGTGEAAVRVPSACLSVICVPLTYALARRVASEPVSLLSAFLVAVSPFQVMAGQEARMYPLLEALTLGSTLALAAGVERGGARRWAGYAVLAVLMVYTQYLGFLVLLAHGVWVAGWERRHLGTWLGAMGAAAVLYAPWVPALSHQAAAQHERVWPQHSLASFDLGALLGLFAFGGSLLGMPSYLLPRTLPSMVQDILLLARTLPPMEQGILLLPFLVILWRGAASFASDRRGLALIGLPPALVIGVMFAVVLGAPVMYPHGVSFLCPFYAMFLARGLVDVADRMRGRRDRVLAFLTAGLLLYSVPVLDRYYFDPSSWPFRWRAAADLVRSQVRPGDFIIYVEDVAVLPFAYYFREPHPATVLRAAEGLPGGNARPGFTRTEAEALAARHRRVWLIATVTFHAHTQDRLLPALRSAFEVTGFYDFTGTWVYLLQANPGRGPGVVRRPPSPAANR